MDRNLQFELDDTNELLQKYYQENDNYKIIVNNENSKRCIIFFSGNGLYFPNTYEVFHEKVEVQDRYEWESVAKSPLVQNYYGTIIFVRDICKTFYVRGINASLSSIDQLLLFLKKITDGMHVVTCGNSAGGYMAVVAGAYLKANIIFSFGGQWNIAGRKDYYLTKFKEQCKDYYDITRYAKNNVIWFYSALNENDTAQKRILEEREKDGILSFAIASKYHGDLLLFPCYEKILILPMIEIERLNKKYGGKLITQRRFARELLKGRELIQTCMKDIIHHHKSLQILRALFMR